MNALCISDVTKDLIAEMEGAAIAGQCDYLIRVLISNPHPPHAILFHSVEWLVFVNKECAAEWHLRHLPGGVQAGLMRRNRLTKPWR